MSHRQPLVDINLPSFKNNLHIKLNKMNQEKTILEEASEVVSGERAVEYGDATTSFNNIAKGWSVIVGKEITGRQVALMMAWLKIVRENNNHKRDNLVDCAAYAYLASKLL